MECFKHVFKKKFVKKTKQKKTKSQFEIWNASILKTVLLLIIILPRFKIV